MTIAVVVAAFWGAAAVEGTADLVDPMIGAITAAEIFAGAVLEIRLGSEPEFMTTPEK